MGYVSFEGRAFLEGSRGGAWQNGEGHGDPGLGTGNGGGPFAVFANPADEVVVISAVQ